MGKCLTAVEINKISHKSIKNKNHILFCQKSNFVSSRSLHIHTLAYSGKVKGQTPEKKVNQIHRNIAYLHSKSRVIPKKWAKIRIPVIR